MRRLEKLQQKGRRRILKDRIVTTLVVTLFMLTFVGVSAVAFFVLQGREFGGQRVTVTAPDQMVANELQFPIGVNPKQEMIVENPEVDTYFETHILAKSGSGGRRMGWLSKVMGKLALMDWYQNLASASSRLLVIQPGERKEEIGAHFAKILGWDAADRALFIDTVTKALPVMEEGKFFPGRYVVPKGTDPALVVDLILERFNAGVLSRYGTTTEAIVPMHDALTIASLLEREAYDFTDMRQIAGVIWNRLFIDMNLQIDATLQYAKGSSPQEPWWPKVVPKDKYIESLYNTYENSGLPPAPIANPSLEAVLAALNPKKTDCLYYFHDRDAGFHCTSTYEEHVRLLKQYYGRGK